MTINDVHGFDSFVTQADSYIGNLPVFMMIMISFHKHWHRKPVATVWGFFLPRFDQRRFDQPFAEWFDRISNKTNVLIGYRVSEIFLCLCCRLIPFESLQLSKQEFASIHRISRNGNHSTVAKISERCAVGFPLKIRPQNGSQRTHTQ